MTATSTRPLHDFARGFAAGAHETLAAVRALLRALAHPLKRRACARQRRG
jgi:hypothetical protein